MIRKTLTAVVVLTTILFLVGLLFGDWSRMILIMGAFIVGVGMTLAVDWIERKTIP